MYKCLGDHIADGFDPLYTKRSEKAQGYSASCLAMCSEMSLGYQLYHISKLLHHSIFINGTLVNMETWPNCTTSRIEIFERIEQIFFRKILSAHSKTPIEAIYLEMGILPFRFHLMKKRILYLHSILNREDGEITKEIVLLQKIECYDGDFYAQSERDMKALGIEDTDLLMKKDSFNEMLSKKIEGAAFCFLIEKAKVHSKVNEHAYTDCKGAEYFQKQCFSPDLANILFQFRTRCFLVKNNFRNNYKNTNIICPLCQMEDDTQEHLFQCVKIRSSHSSNNSKHEDIFSKNINDLLRVATELKKLVEIRKRLLDQ